MKGIQWITAALCFVAIFLNQTDGGTWQKQTPPETVHGRQVFFCEYKGVRLLAKSKFKDYDDCADCTCNKGGHLSCADIGSSRLTVHGESDCEPVRIGCKFRWVLKSDTTKKCPRKRMPYPWRRLDE